MVSYTTNGGTAIRHYIGKAADEKPVEGVPNGSDFYELDGNHDVYIFDGDTREWVLQ